MSAIYIGISGNEKRVLRARYKTPKKIIDYLLAILLVVSPIWHFFIPEQSVFAATTTVRHSFTYDTTGTHNVIIPPYAANVTVEAWGGGGGGGGAYNGTILFAYAGANAGGGGGGAYSKKNFGNFQSGGAMSITVGNRGTAGTAGASGNVNHATAGTASTVSFGGMTVSAGGGNGGQSSSGNQSKGNGGAGGTASGGDINTSGGNGEDGYFVTGVNGNGYGGAGGSGANGGAGGSRTATGRNGYDGDSGDAPGGGGGGARASSFSGVVTAAGSSGGYGKVSLSYDVVTTSIGINSVSPSYGPDIGQNEVTITGSGFSSVSFTRITVGGVSATNVVVVNDTTLRLTVPSYIITAGETTELVDVAFYYADGFGFTYSTSKVDFYEYRVAAREYDNECREDPSSDWEEYAYVPQGATVECRITLDGMYNGNIGLSDDYKTTINPSLSGVFASSDSRFVNGEFVLTYSNTANETSQVMYYTYTSPSSAVLESHYTVYADGTDNGYDLYWPAINVEATGAALTSAGDEVVLGLLAEQYYISPSRSDTFYCTNCVSGFVISTHGAPYFGTIDLIEDLSQSDNPSGTIGVFTVAGEETTEIDFSPLEGADIEFNYTPKTTATMPSFIRINGVSSDPAIIDDYVDIEAISAGFIITGTTNLKRGETGSYSLEAIINPNWSGTVVLTDLFSTGEAANGVFVDTTSTPGLTGTFNAATNTYTFVAGGNEDYIRTFEYTLRDDAVVPPDFSSYQVDIIGNSTNPDGVGRTLINVLADKLTIKCSAGYPNCTTMYVGERKDFSIAPNGTLVGSALVTDSGGGGFLNNNGIASWASTVPFVVSYTPGAPGRKVLTTTVLASSSNADMVNIGYSSLYSDSLNSFIYVMANSATLTGYSNLAHGQSGSYTLTMNGPYVGDIYLVDTIDGVDANGTFSNGGVCSFSLASYNVGLNTTSCIFNYTPDEVNEDTILNISAKTADSYGHLVSITPKAVAVYPQMVVSGVIPSGGPIAGGEQITISGKGFLPIAYGEIPQCYADDEEDCIDVVLDLNGTPAICENTLVLSSTTITCTTSAHDAGWVDVYVDNGLEDATLIDGFIYIDITLDIGVTEGVLVVSTSPSDDTQTASATVTVSTNSPNGYVVTVEMISEEQRLKNESMNYYLNQTNGSWASPITLSTNTWGFATTDGIFSGGKFAAIPKKGSPQTIMLSNSPTISDVSTIYTGANVDTTQPAGSYVGSILYTAVPNI